MWDHGPGIKHISNSWRKVTAKQNDSKFVSFKINGLRSEQIDYVINKSNFFNDVIRIQKNLILFYLCMSNSVYVVFKQSILLYIIFTYFNPFSHVYEVSHKKRDYKIYLLESNEIKIGTVNDYGINKLTASFNINFRYIILYIYKINIFENIFISIDSLKFTRPRLISVIYNKLYLISWLY